MLVKAASDCHGDHNAFWKKIKHLRGHNTQVVPYILHNDIKITDIKEQTRVLAKTWDYTFRVLE